MRRFPAGHALAVCFHRCISQRRFVRGDFHPGEVRLGMTAVAGAADGQFIAGEAEKVFLAERDAFETVAAHRAAALRGCHLDCTSVP